MTATAPPTSESALRVTGLIVSCPRSRTRPAPPSTRCCIGHSRSCPMTPSAFVDDVVGIVGHTGVIAVIAWATPRAVASFVQAAVFLVALCHPDKARRAEATRLLRHLRGFHAPAGRTAVVHRDRQLGRVLELLGTLVLGTCGPCGHGCGPRRPLADRHRRPSPIVRRPRPSCNE
jgi:hypothetical protein